MDRKLRNGRHQEYSQPAALRGEGSTLGCAGRAIWEATIGVASAGKGIVTKKLCGEDSPEPINACQWGICVTILRPVARRICSIHRTSLRVLRKSLSRRPCKETDVTTALVMRLNSAAVARIWAQQTWWRNMRPDGWWCGVQPDWPWSGYMAIRAAEGFDSSKRAGIRCRTDSKVYGVFSQGGL
jgi:hypothetical protein